MSQETAAPQNSGKALMKLRRDRTNHLAAIFIAATALSVGIPVLSTRQDAAIQKLDQTKNNTSMILRFRAANEYVFRTQCYFERNSGSREMKNDDQFQLCVSEKAIHSYRSKIAKQEDAIKQGTNIGSGALALLSLSVALIAGLRTRHFNARINEIKQADFKL